MSELCRGKVQRCSMEWLIRRIHRMRGTVSLTIVLGDPERERGRREALERYWRRREELRAESAARKETAEGASSGA